MSQSQVEQVAWQTCQGAQQSWGHLSEGNHVNKFSGLTLLSLSNLFLELPISLNPARSQSLWESIEVAHVSQPPGSERTVEKGRV